MTNVSTALTQLLERITLIGNALDLGREYISLMHIDSTVDENYHDLAKESDDAGQRIWSSGGHSLRYLQAWPSTLVDGADAWPIPTHGLRSTTVQPGFSGLPSGALLTQKRPPFIKPLKLP